MPFDIPVNLIVNSFSLALATAFLLIVLWYDVRRTANQFFAIFLVLVQIWNIGFLLQQITGIVQADDSLFNVGYGMALAGYIGASISLYALMTVVVGVQPRRFLGLTLLYIMAGICYSIWLVASSEGRADNLQARWFAGFFFLVFDALSLYVTWHFRRKFQSLTLTMGVLLFIVGQAVSFLNPVLGIVSLSTSISSLGALAISFAIVRRELIRPLLERSNQLESMQEVSVAISSRLATDAILNEIAERAASWLQADAAGIFLKRGSTLSLVAIHNLPPSMLDTEVFLGRGVAGKVAQTKESIYLENYPRDWRGEDDLPLARETFGSLISVPLIYAEEVIGVLMVIGGAHSHLFEKKDARLLELLATQAAVAISNGRLFNTQKNLTEQLSNAHEQLRTVLISTENPVLALDRRLNLIFTNPAAEEIFGLDTIHSRAHLIKAIPDHALPKKYKEALRSIRNKGSYRYEIELEGHTYIAQLASLGSRRHIEGFVAVLNDVSELKELDRIKSEMVRMTSHDLKNPLQAAFSNLELLRDDVVAANNSEMTLSVDNIERQLNKMHRIISGILDLERVRVGSNLNELCQIRLIIEEAAEELDDFAKEHQISLRLDISPKVADFLGDTAQFKRAMVNIIENAIKFNSAGGEVLISAKNEANKLLIIVSDDGIGIPEDLQGKIFERFFRGHQKGAEHISGSGLGLSLVKAVVESHNGQIWVRSKANVGTSFHISVPTVPRSFEQPS
jgi:two-component system, OmpR family, phosphate regulon sensor histidine kinase PhoR